MASEWGSVADWVQVGVGVVTAVPAVIAAVVLLRDRARTQSSRLRVVADQRNGTVLRIIVAYTPENYHEAVDLELEAHPKDVLVVKEGDEREEREGPPYNPGRVAYLPPDGATNKLVVRTRYFGKEGASELGETFMIWANAYPISFDLVVTARSWPEKKRLAQKRAKISVNR